MKLYFHPAVQSDLKQALEYFDRAGGAKLGDRFFAELETLLERISLQPSRYGFYGDDIRRAPLQVFQYHLLYRVRPEGVKILVLRHHRRNPKFGLSRR